MLKRTGKTGLLGCKGKISPINHLSVSTLGLFTAHQPPLYLDFRLFYIRRRIRDRRRNKKSKVESMGSVVVFYNSNAEAQSEDRK